MKGNDFMQKFKIGTLEAIMLILSIAIVHTILSLPIDILTHYRSGSILNLIYIGILALLIVYLISLLFKKFPGLDLIDISEFVGGKVFKNIIGIIFIVYFIVTSSLLLRNFCEILKTVYYPMTNIAFIISLFVIAVCLANRLDFNSTLKTNLIILPIVLISIIFLFVSNLNKFSPEKLFPILGDGFFNTFILGITNLSSFGGIAFIYFLPPYLENPNKFKHISLLSTGITTIYLILSVASLLFLFSFYINATEISPLYNATRYIEFGSFVQRLESVFLLIWIIAFACYLSIIIKFSITTFKKILNLKTEMPLIDSFGLAILSIALLPKNFAVLQTFESQVYPYLVLGIVFILGIGILIFANLYKRKQKTLLNQNYERKEK